MASNNTTEPFDMSCLWTTDPDSRVMTSIHLFFSFSIIFVIVGLIGNGLSIAVFSSKEMQGVSSNIYLLALAASDSLYLVSMFITKTLTMMRCWLFPTILIDVTNHSPAMCLLMQYLSDLFSDYSTCLILAFTIERSVAVFLPIRYKELCTVTRARFVCASLFGAIAVIIAPYHFTLMQLYDDYHMCAVAQNYEKLFAILYVIEMLMLRVWPVLVIAVLNAFIIARVTKLTRAKNRRRAASKQLIDNSTGGWTAARNHRSGGGGCGGGGGVGVNGKSRAKNEDRNLQLTVILILVSTSYIILYIPVLIDFCLRKLEPDVIQPSKESMAIVGMYSKILYICGFSINFFLYTMSGRVFRDQLRNILCPKRRSEDAETSMTIKTLATTAPEASSAV